MGGERPKQYLPLGGRMVIEHTLGRLLGHPLIQGVYVALSADDAWWVDCAYARHPGVRRVAGGGERCHSVLN
ncbi:MAG: 2-C-methyl-D-erythritol 4-phosphate cytidylyltransferase, partial [Candidatus Sedimenticola endophacoides]